MKGGIITDWMLGSVIAKFLLDDKKSLAKLFQFSASPEINERSSG
jgi:hypothetical protein